LIRTSSDQDEFATFLRRVRRDLVFDCMLEAKAKELALLRLRDQLAPVITEGSGPPVVSGVSK
jgi:hypothetical protein